MVRLTSISQWSGRNTGHGSITLDSGFDHVVTMQSDNIIANFAFNLRFTIKNYNNREKELD